MKKIAGVAVFLVVIAVPAWVGMFAAMADGRVPHSHRLVLKMDTVLIATRDGQSAAVCEVVESVPAVDLTLLCQWFEPGALKRKSGGGESSMSSASP